MKKQFIYPEVKRLRLSGCNTIVTSNSSFVVDGEDDNDQNLAPSRVINTLYPTAVPANALEH